MLPTAEISAYGRAIDSLVTLAQNDLHALWSHAARQAPEQARDLLLEIMPALVDQYGSAAAAIADEWYRDMRMPPDHVLAALCVERDHAQDDGDPGPDGLGKRKMR